MIDKAALRVVTLPTCTICGLRMIPLKFAHIRDRWVSCPSAGKITGVYVCSGSVSGDALEPLNYHVWDQEALAFFPHLLNFWGRLVFGWHVRVCFWEDVAEKMRAMRHSQADMDAIAKEARKAGPVVVFPWVSPMVMAYPLQA